jgi:hypothetical protein
VRIKHIPKKGEKLADVKQMEKATAIFYHYYRYHQQIYHQYYLISSQ